MTAKPCVYSCTGLDHVKYLTLRPVLQCCFISFLWISYIIYPGQTLMSIWQSHPFHQECMLSKSHSILSGIRVKKKTSWMMLSAPFRLTDVGLTHFSVALKEVLQIPTTNIHGPRATSVSSHKLLIYTMLDNRLLFHLLINLTYDPKLWGVSKKQHCTFK